MKVLVTIPAYNEEKILEKSIIKLNNFLKSKLKHNYLIEIADNRSKDNTKEVGKKLEKKIKNVKYTYIDKQGKGRAIKASWRTTGKNYDILSFMDADLATDISYFPKLINTIAKEGYDISIGSRYNKKSIIKRTFIRNIIGKGYLFIQRILFGVKYEDTQCGFKAIKREKYHKLQNDFNPNKLKFDKTDLFFDTELLLIASRIYNYKIKSVPVKWEEAEKSEVNMFRVSWFFFSYLLKIKKYLKKLKQKRRKI